MTVVGWRSIRPKTTGMETMSAAGSWIMTRQTPMGDQPVTGVRA